MDSLASSRLARRPYLPCTCRRAPRRIQAKHPQGRFAWATLRALVEPSAHTRQRVPASRHPLQKPQKTFQLRPVSALTKIHIHKYTISRLRRTSVRRHAPARQLRPRPCSFFDNQTQSATRLASAGPLRRFPAPAVSSPADEFAQPLMAKIARTSTRTSQYVRSCAHMPSAKPLPRLHLLPRLATHENQQRVCCCASLQQCCILVRRNPRKARPSSAAGGNCRRPAI